MAKLPDMTKHRGFPSGMPGTGIQFVIRRANPKRVTPIKALPRRARQGSKEHLVDAAFLHALCRLDCPSQPQGSPPRPHHGKGR